MTLTLNINPKLEKRLKDEAQQRGIPLEVMVEQELEQLWMEETPLKLSDMLSLGSVESDFDAEESEAWLFKQWSQI